MRIISKYKDFYDYYAQDYNADVTYVRKPFVITDKIDFSDRLGRGVVSSRYWSGRIGAHDISLQAFIFGIYPNVYMSPYAMIRCLTVTMNSEYIPYFFTLEDLAEIRKNEDLIAFCDKKAREYISNQELLRPLKNYEYWTYEKNIGESVMRNVAKAECKDVFLKYGAPVFCEYNDKVIDTKPYLDVKEYKGEADAHKWVNIHWIANCCFSKVGTDMLKIWGDEVMGLGTYTNIENFLWASKQEPISEPDNKTKIINHGFDLKTSFRNVK